MVPKNQLPEREKQDGDTYHPTLVIITVFSFVEFLRKRQVAFPSKL
jgi:hypothetical protein